MQSVQSSVQEMRSSVFNPRVFLQTIITLASASLGLVAALAWNEAIKATLTEILGEGNDLAGLYTYAILATTFAIVIVVVLGYIAAKVGGEAAITRRRIEEAEHVASRLRWLFRESIRHGASTSPRSFCYLPNHPVCGACHVRCASLSRCSAPTPRERDN